VADAWRGLPSGPPRFVNRALAALAAAKPGHAGLAKALSSWRARWNLGTQEADTAAPPGVDAGAWFAHQAARALLRDDAAQAQALLQRTRASLPAVDRLAQAQALGRAFGVGPPALLVDLVDLLSAHPEGASVLGRPASEAREKLAALAERPDTPGRLLHHVALLESRLAGQFEASDPALATLHARRAWGAWLGFFASPDGPTPEARRALIEHLVGRHRRRVNDHLARDEREPARSHWQLVTQLPALARGRAPALAEEVAACVGRFREELVTEYLLATREAMRFGDAPEGWRADYERGLASLEQLLAIDPDDVRLLTAHAEMCADWFLDLYNLHDRRLFDEVERRAPFAERLAELVGEEEGELAARSALSEFWKFRGFCAGDRREKLELYRQALAFHPANDNVRNLIADLGGDDE
jgi:tetratricopeptide (TPR) repeat protein